MNANKKNQSSGEKITIKLVRSLAGRDKWTKATADALGLYKIGSTSSVAKNPATLGMVKRLSHLVEIQ